MVLLVVQVPLQCHTAVIQDVVERCLSHIWHPSVGSFLQRLRLELCGCSSLEFKAKPHDIIQ